MDWAFGAGGHQQQESLEMRQGKAGGSGVAKAGFVSTEKHRNRLVQLSNPACCFEE